MADTGDGQGGVDSGFYTKNLHWALVTGGILVQVGSQAVPETDAPRLLIHPTCKVLPSMPCQHQTNASLNSQVPCRVRYRVNV